MSTSNTPKWDYNKPPEEWGEARQFDAQCTGWAKFGESRRFIGLDGSPDALLAMWTAGDIGGEVCNLLATIRLTGVPGASGLVEAIASFVEGTKWYEHCNYIWEPVDEAAGTA